MNRRMLFAISLTVASVFASEAVYAAPAIGTASHVPVHAMFGKSKLVKLSLRNDGSAPLTLKVGEEIMTLEVGKTKSLELPVGTRIVRPEATSTQPAGSVVTEVTKELNGATIALKS